MTGFVFYYIVEPEYLENQFTLNNSMWFAIGALLQQGSEIEPKYEPFDFNFDTVKFG